jgi:Cu/Ag efflux pump CusA
MLTAIVRQSLRYPWLVLLGALTLLASGIMVLRQAPFDVFPEFVPPQATVQTEAPGFVPEQVEALVTHPLEAVINGSNGVETVRSESIQGLSVINITFREGSDPYRARQQVAEALSDAAARLPAGSGAPHITPLTSSTMDLLKVGLVSDYLSPMALRELAEWTVRPRLLAAHGVARVNVFGGDERRIEVRARPEALLARGLTLSDLSAAVSRAVAVNGGGFADTHNQRILIDPGASATTAQAVAEAVLNRAGGGTVRIGDVAEVADTAAPRFGDALVRGRPGVLLTVSSQ